MKRRCTGGRARAFGAARGDAGPHTSRCAVAAAAAACGMAGAVAARKVEFEFELRFGGCYRDAEGLGETTGGWQELIQEAQRPFSSQPSSRTFPVAAVLCGADRLLAPFARGGHRPFAACADRG